MIPFTPDYHNLIPSTFLLWILTISISDYMKISVNTVCGIVASIHSLAIALYASYELYLNEYLDDPNSANNYVVFSYNIIHISLTYFISDICVHAVHRLAIWNGYKDKDDFDLLTLIHHICVPVVMIYSHDNMQGYFTALALLSEYSPIFLHICKKPKNFSPLVFKISAALLILTFFFFRVINFGYITYVALSYRHLEISTCMGSLFLMNVYWFYKILKRASSIKKE